MGDDLPCYLNKILPVSLVHVVINLPEKRI